METTVVDKLLEIDRKARQTIDEARQYYDNTMQEIESERRRLAAEYRRRADEHLEDVRHTEESFQAEQLGAIRQEHDALQKRLDDAYEQNHEGWENEMLRRILAGEAR